MAGEQNTSVENRWILTRTRHPVASDGSGVIAFIGPDKIYTLANETINLENPQGLAHRRKTASKEARTRLPMATSSSSLFLTDMNNVTDIPHISSNTKIYLARLHDSVKLILMPTIL